jgi:dihydrofolate synthase/folylpolyglutamate synthase
VSPRAPGREAEDAAGLVAERWLAGLDPIGWRFGLDRIKALLAALGDPQLGFESIHVVGTNGKSSVTQMTAALIESSGRTTGAYLSPHSERWAERVRIRGAEVDGDDFARAVGAVADAVPDVESGFEEGERVTQFEAATAAAFVALRDAEVEVGVIEAGLGGRLDATNVLESQVTVLTSIGLDHTQWLGDTELEIAGEKLAVLRPSTKLVTGNLSPEVAEKARAHAAKLDCKVVDTTPEGETSHAPPYTGAIGTFRSSAPYLRRNLAVAVAAAEAFLGEPLGDVVVANALERLDLPGRFELIEGDPPMIRDAAHNPDGAAALAEALQAEMGERPIIACLAVLGDKDARGALHHLARSVAVR